MTDPTTNLTSSFCRRCSRTLRNPSSIPCFADQVEI